MEEFQNTSIDFYISFYEPQAHYAEIAIHIKNFVGEYLDLKMPVWTPGSYLIREFAKNVEQFEVSNADEESIRHRKTAKNTWRVYHDSQDMVVRYRIYGFEASVRTNFIDDAHAFLSPAATFMYVDGQVAHPATITVQMPKYWTKVSTGLPKIDGDFRYYAENFDILFDSPIEIGNQEVWNFNAAGIPHEFAMVGGGNYDKEQLSLDIQKIVEEETQIWGSNPNDHYVFITHNYQNGGGGLEHLNSTVLGASRNAYTQTSSYKAFLGLVAHEYFHLWNVKRLRPKPLGPFNYDTENYTSLLWIMEGFTAYYDNLVIRRCGFWDENEYLQMLAQDFNTVYNRPGYEIQSVGLSSFDAWIKHYRPDENSPNTSISYYNKGAMLAVALDLQIISASGGTKRLDDVLKASYAKFYITEDRGFDEVEFKELAEEVTGTDLTPIFNAVYVTEELDYNSYFSSVGYELVDLNANLETNSIGIRTAVQDGRIVIKGVNRNSTAWHAGLNVNDEIVGINNHRMDSAGKELEYVLQTNSYGEQIDVLIARDGLLRTIPTIIGRSEKKSFVIRRKAGATNEERRLGDTWLTL